MNDKYIEKLKEELELKMLEVITVLNQQGMNYDFIEYCIRTSFCECIESYDNNRDLLTKVIKKIKNEEISNE